MTLRVNLAGVLSNAARCIDAMRDELMDRMTPEEFEQFDEECQSEAEMGMLREIAEHARQVKTGEETLDEFARHYCLRDGAK